MLPNLEGIARITELHWRDGELKIRLILDGLPDRPLEVIARDIGICPDGSVVRLGSFAANMAFAQNALNRFAARTFRIPVSARPAVIALRQALDLDGD